MFNVVNEFKKEDTPESVDKLIFKRFPSKESVNANENGHVDDEIHGHLVVNNHDWK